MDINDAKFAIIHDWFIQKSFGGAEKVTLLLDKYLIKNYSKPDIFSLVTDIDKSNNSYLKYK